MYVHVNVVGFVLVFYTKTVSVTGTASSKCQCEAFKLLIYLPFICDIFIDNMCPVIVI